MTTNPTIKALIHVRAGSERVKNKNIRPFAGSSLLEIKIRQMQRIRGVDSVVVNSDSNEMLTIAKECGSETVKRDPYFSSSSVPMNEVHRNMAENFDGNIVICTPCTTPLVKDETIEKALEIYLSSLELYDSLNTAHSLKEFMFLDNKPYNWDISKTPRSQDLPNILGLNFAVNIISKELWYERGHVIGKNPNISEISDIESIDIDNEIDFEIAEFLFTRSRLCSHDLK